MDGSDTSRSSRAPGRIPYGMQVLLVTAMGTSMSALDTTIVNVARDTMAKDLGRGIADVSWVMSGYSIVYAAVLLTAGRLADRFGRKRTYLLGLSVFMVSSAVCGLAPSLGWLLAARGVQAVGGALLSPAALALVLPEFPMERRSAAIGIWSSIGAISAALGPVLGGLLIRVADWRAAFWVNIPFCIASLVLGRRVLRESSDPHAQGLPDPLSIVSGIGAVAVLVLAITKGNSWGYLGGRAGACAAIVAVLLPVFVWRCRTAALPVLDLALLRSRSFRVANVSMLAFAIPFYGSVWTNVSFLQQLWRYSPLHAGIGVLPGPLTAMLVARRAGAACDRIGHRVVGSVGGLVIASAAIGYALRTGTEARYWTHFFPMQLVTGCGIGLLIPSLQSGAVKFLPSDRYAMGAAFFATLRQVGQGLAVAIMAAAVTRRHGTPLSGYRLGWMIQTAGGLTVALLMGLRFRPPEPSPDPTAAPARPAPPSSAPAVLQQTKVGSPS